MIRRFGTPPKHGKTYVRRPGAYAILPRDEQVLLTHQITDASEFQLPGGGIDPGESPIAALHREVFEETGWHISDPRRLGAFRRFTFMPEYNLWAEKLCTIYVARPVTRLGPPVEKNHTAIWMPCSDVTEVLANAGDCHFVTRFFTGVQLR